MEKVLHYIDEHQQEYVALLQALVRQPSQATTGEGIDEMVRLVVQSLKTVGCEPVVYPTGGNPVVYAELKGESPRVFGFYDHYDVQPVDPVELWDDDPYSATIHDGCIWGRGVSDNKNGIASKICAIDAWLKTHGTLPCGIKFLIEGEEEIGAPHLPEFAEAHPELLACDGYNWESGWKESGRPAEIHLGNKGLLYVEYHIRTANIDAHSMNAAIVPNPAWRLVKALNSILDPKTGKILIDGFYDGIPPLTPREEEMLEQDDFDEQYLLDFVGTDHFIHNMKGLDVRRAFYCAPTANICGIWSGYTGQGSKTVLPKEASAKMDFRLVPGQDPQRIIRLLRAHLDAHGFQDIEFKVLSAQPAFKTAPDSLFIRAVAEGMRQLFREEPSMHLCTAGTSPQTIFCSKTNIPSALFGCVSIFNRVHSPNERMPVKNYMDEIKMMATIMKTLAEA